MDSSSSYFSRKLNWSRCLCGLVVVVVVVVAVLLLAQAGNIVKVHHQALQIGTIITCILKYFWFVIGIKTHVFNMRLNVRVSWQQELWMLRSWNQKSAYVSKKCLRVFLTLQKFRSFVQKKKFSARYASASTLYKRSKFST